MPGFSDLNVSMFSSPKLDYLSGTIKLHPDLPKYGKVNEPPETIQNVFDGIAHYRDQLEINETISNSLRFKADKFNKPRFANCAIFPVDSEMTGERLLSISYYPFAKDGSIAIECCPVPRTSSDINRLYEHLVGALGKELASCVFHGLKITRIDIAVDSDISGFDRYFFDFTESEIVTMNFRHGRIHEIYIGSPYSDNYIRIYDKTLEQLERKSIKKHLPDPKLRFEFVAKPGCSIADLNDISNPLSRLVCYKKSDVAKYVDREFYLDCRELGLKTAIQRLSRLDKNRARRVKRILSKRRVELFDRDHQWQVFLKSLSMFGSVGA
jgi:hypothetical protein